MINLDSALKILKKYGYNSRTVHPFLYKKNKEVGVYYSYIDEKYGITERVVSFHNDMDLDLFLKRYQWYKLNGKQNNVSLRLNNYEIPNPELLYIRNNHVMTDNEMFNIKLYDKIEQNNRQLSHKNRLLIEAEDLMNHYYIEKEIKEKYTNNLLNKERELKRYYLELQELIDKYNKKKTNIELEEDNRVFSVDLDEESRINAKIAEYKNKLPDDDQLKKLNYSIWNLNKKLETNKYYMYALKYNDDVDEEMRLVVTKIDYMKELLSKRRSIFKIVDLKRKFENIDSQSTYESIYDDNFDEKFKEFINKKYDVLDDINEFRLCEYLNNFKTNNEYDIKRNIDRCKKEISDTKEVFNANIKEVAKDLRRQFYNNLNEEERNALILYSSYYRELFEMIQSIDGYEKLHGNEILSILNITDKFAGLLEQCYTYTKELLNDIDNDFYKNTIFRNINFDSEEKFIQSIKNNIRILLNINDKIVLKNNIRLYFSTNEMDDINKKKLIVTSTFIAPYMINKGGNYKAIAANVKKGISVLFSPKYISLPPVSAYSKKIKLMEKYQPDIILDTGDITINNDFNTITYSRFKTHIVKEDEFSYVDSVETDYKIKISKVMIEKRNKNE